MNRALLIIILLTGCGPLVNVEDETLDQTQQPLAVPSEDQPDSVDVGSWNVEWYGDATNGPANETRQQTNVERVVTQLNLDLLGLVEVVSKEAFDALLLANPGCDGFLANDPRVENGAAFYSASEQKVGLVFKKRFTVESARLVLTESAYAFGGRPPLEVKLKFTEGGRARSVVVVVAHLKAMADYDGWNRRTQSAAALKTWLDATYPTRWVLVIGDWNDDLDVSTYRGRTSPFEALAHDANYRFTTDALTAAGTPTTVDFPNTIDHHLATNELAARYVEGSAHVVPLQKYVSSYGTTTSDHYPVVTRYDLR